MARVGAIVQLEPTTGKELPTDLFGRAIGGEITPPQSRSKEATPDPREMARKANGLAKSVAAIVTGPSNPSYQTKKGPLGAALDHLMGVREQLQKDEETDEDYEAAIQSLARLDATMDRALEVFEQGGGSRRRKAQRNPEAHWSGKAAAKMFAAEDKAGGPIPVSVRVPGKRGFKKTTYGELAEASVRRGMGAKIGAKPGSAAVTDRMLTPKRPKRSESAAQKAAAARNLVIARAKKK